MIEALRDHPVFPHAVVSRCAVGVLRLFVSLWNFIAQACLRLAEIFLTQSSWYWNCRCEPPQSARFCIYPKSDDVIVLSGSQWARIIRLWLRACQDLLEQQLHHWAPICKCSDPPQTYSNSEVGTVVYTLICTSGAWCASQSLKPAVKASRESFSVPPAP